jgi:DNA polymerase V
MLHRTFASCSAPADDARGASGSVRTRTVAAGFGSPADDMTVKRIDLNDALIRHPEATFVMRAAGDAMRDAGIESGDVLLVDRALKPTHGNVVVVVVDGEMLCRRLWSQESAMKLLAAHPDFSEIVPTQGAEFEFWGVVTHVIKQLIG